MWHVFVKTTVSFYSFLCDEWMMLLRDASIVTKEILKGNWLFAGHLPSVRSLHFARIRSMHWHLPDVQQAHVNRVDDSAIVEVRQWDTESKFAAWQIVNGAQYLRDEPERCYCWGARIVTMKVVCLPQSTCVQYVLQLCINGIQELLKLHSSTTFVHSDPHLKISCWDPPSYSAWFSSLLSRFLYPGKS